MKNVLLLFALGAIAIGCDAHPAATSSDLNATSQPPAFAFSGYVRDENGVPIPAAEVSVTTSTFRGADFTNASGYFMFQKLRGPAHIRIWRAPYEFYVRDTVVSSNVAIDVRLKTAQYADALVLGKAVRSFVASGSPPCDPIGWDVRAPCRRFLFTPGATGQLVISVTWIGEPNVDVTITTTGGVYLGMPNEGSVGQIGTSAVVQAGVTYEVRVTSYYGVQVFDIRADLTQ